MIIFMATGLSGLRLQPGEPFPFALLWGSGPATGRVAPPPNLPASTLELLLMMAMFFLTLILILWIITFIIRPQARKRMLRRILIYLVLLLLAHSVLNFVEKLEALNDPAANEAAQGQTEPTGLAEPPPSPPAFVINHPQWLVWGVAFVLMSLILVGGWFIFRSRSLAEPAAETDRLDLLLREARQAIDHLQQGGDLRNSVLDCYQAMSRILSEEQGIEREQGMTARDFEQHLAEIGFKDEHIRRLTRLFEKVRYGRTTPSPAEETEAIDCLSAIVQSYGNPA
jgi:hypothetical protein